MMKLRPAPERGHFDHGWLNTYHTFSFADYRDRDHMAFRSLRVINEDFVAAAQGFGTHGHRDMEIITYVLEGALEHKDSMGNGSVIRPGDVQYMCAGTGVTHSEFNHETESHVHLYQIWVLPDRAGHIPRYDQKQFTRESRLNQLRLIASMDGREGSIAIHQDVAIYASLLEMGKITNYSLAPGRAGWVQLARGSLVVGNQPLNPGDGLAIEGEKTVKLQSQAADTEFLFFDLV